MKKKTLISLIALALTTPVISQGINTQAEQPTVVEQHELPPMDERPQGVSFYGVQIVNQKTDRVVEKLIFSTTRDAKEAEAAILQLLETEYEIVNEESGIINPEEDSGDFDVVMRVVVSAHKEGSLETLAQQAEKTTKHDISEVENFDEFAKLMKEHTYIKLLPLQQLGDHYDELVKLVEEADGDWEKAELAIYQKFPKEFGIDKKATADDVRHQLADHTALKIDDLKKVSDIHFLPFTHQVAQGKMETSAWESMGYTVVSAVPSKFSKKEQEQLSNHLLETFKELEIMNEKEFEKYSQGELFKALNDSMRLGADPGYVVQLLRQD